MELSMKPNGRGMDPIEVVQNGCMYTRKTDEERGLQQVVRFGLKMEDDKRVAK